MNDPRDVSRGIIQVWFGYGFRTINLPIAFALLRYDNTIDKTALLAAGIPLYAKVKSGQIETMKEAEIAPLVEQVELAVRPHRNRDWFALIPARDPWWAVIRPYYELYSNIIPDPADGINLRAFAFDSESVHRKSTQGMLMANLAKLRAVPVPKDLDIFEEFVLPLPEPIAYVLVKDYQKLSIPLATGPVAYSMVFNHLWSYIRNHQHKDELIKRLGEEIEEGVGVCPNGKLARLMNVVEGYMEGISTASPKELFQNRMAVIATMEKSAQLKAATDAFQEFEIPEGERGHWLEALE